MATPTPTALVHRFFPPTLTRRLRSIRRSLFKPAALLCSWTCAIANVASGYTATWLGTTNNDWGTSTNWKGVPLFNGQDQILLSGTENQSQTLGANRSLNTLTFANEGFLLSGSSIVLQNPGAGIFSSGSNTIASDVTTAAPSTFYSSGGLLTFSGQVYGNTGNSPTIDGPGDALISGRAGGYISKTGSGTLTLSNTNNWYTQLTVNDGTLMAGANGRLNTAGCLALYGGTFDLNGFSPTIDNLYGSGTVLLRSGTLTLRGAANSWGPKFSGTISGDGGIVIDGDGTQMLTGTNTYKGSTTIKSGYLSICTDAALGESSDPVTIQAGGFIFYDGTSAVGRGITLAGNGTFLGDSSHTTVNLSGAITGPGSLTYSSNDSTWVVTGTHSYLGSTTLYNGKLTLTDSSEVGAAGLMMYSGTTVLAGVTIPGQPLSIAGRLSSSGTSQWKGPVTLRNYSATLSTESASSSLEISGPITLQSNNTLNGSGPGEIRITGGLAGTGSLYLSSTTTTIVSGSNNFGGTVTVYSGTTVFSGGNAVGPAGRVALSGGGVLRIADDETIGTLSYSGAGGRIDLGSHFVTVGGGEVLANIEGSGGLIKQGSRSLALSATSTFSGGTLIAGGVITASQDAFLGSAPLTPTQNLTLASGTFQYTSGFAMNQNRTLLVEAPGGGIDTNGYNVALANRITGAGNLIKTGGGTLTLLSALNDLSGNIVVSSGLVRFGSTEATGLGQIMITGSSAVASNLTQLDQAFLDKFSSGSAGTVALESSSSNPLDFATPGLADLRLGATGTTAYSGLLTPAGGVYKLGGGGGLLLLPGANALTGTRQLDVAIGAVSLDAVNDFSGGTTVGLGGTLIATAPDALGTGDVTIFGGTLSLKGTNALSGSSSLIVNSGTALVYAPQDYSGGTLITGGIVFSGTAGALGSGEVCLNGGTLGFFSTPHVFSGPIRLSASSAIQFDSASTVTTDITVDPTGPKTLTLQGYSSSGTFAGILTDGTASPVSLTKTWFGRVCLTGSNQYSGGTNIEGGTLNVSSDANLGAVPATSATNIKIRWGTLQFGAPFLLSPKRSIALSSTSAAIDTNGYDITIAGELSGTGLIKTGAGKLVLTGTGSAPAIRTIDVQNGTLQMANKAAPALSDIRVRANATYSGTGSVNSIWADTHGTVSGGTPFGQLYCASLYMWNGSELSMTLGGTASNSYSSIATQNAFVPNCGGTVALKVQLANNYEPVVGDTFSILTASSFLSGTFDIVDFPHLSGEKAFRVNYAPNAISLTVDYIRTFLDWSRTRFSPTQQADPNVSGTSADPDGDGRSNLEEYFLATDPLQSDGAPAFTVGSTPWNNDDYVTLTFRQAHRSTDVSYSVEMSQTPQGDWVPVGSEEVAREANADFDLVTIRLSTTTGGSAGQNFRLNLASIPIPAAPVNDNFKKATQLSGTAILVTGSNTSATREPGEPFHAGHHDNRSVWWVWTPTYDGITTISTAGSAFPTALAIYSGSSVGGLQEIASDSQALSGSNASQVTFQASAWVKYYIAVDGWSDTTGNIQLGLQMGTPLPKIEAIANPFWAATITGTGSMQLGTTATLCATAYHGYRFDRWTESGQTVSTTPEFSFLVAGSRSLVANFLDVPPNDDFAYATVLTGTSAYREATNFNASAEAGEPMHSGSSQPGTSVWWTWTAPQTGLAVIRTAESDIATCLAVYTGTSVNALTAVPSKSYVRYPDHVEFDAVAGTTYQIAVEGEGGISGLVNLSLEMPEVPGNDMLANAFVLAGNAVRTVGTNVAANYEPGEPILGEGRTVWWKWTAPATRKVVLSTRGSSFSATAKLFTGSPGALVEAAKDGLDHGAGRFGYHVVAGITYWICVDGPYEDAGTIQLGLSSYFVPGTYAGIITNGAQSHSGSGVVFLKLRSNGTYRITGAYGGHGMKFWNALDPAGVGSGLLPIHLPDTDPDPNVDSGILDFDMLLDLSGTCQLDGTISGSEGMLGNFTAQRVGDGPIPQAGRYTALLLSDPAQSGTDYPQGTGWATIQVQRRGSVLIRGMLGDGTPFCTNSVVTENGEMPVYARLWDGTGSVFGSVRFRDVPGVSDIDGTLKWTKQKRPDDTAYADGFTGEIKLVGSRYVPADLKHSLLELPAGATLELESGPTLPTVTGTVAMAGNTQLAVVGAHDAQISIRVVPLTGKITGSFLPAGSAGPMPFRGVVIQKQNAAGGLIIEPASTGVLEITPAQ